MGLVTPDSGSELAGRPSLTQWRVLERGWLEGSQLVVTPPPPQCEVGTMSVVELKKELQALGLKVSGRKAELQERLFAAAAASSSSSSSCTGKSR